MSRPALKLAPTYNYVDDKHDAYVSPLTLRRLAKEHGRYWLFHSQPTTVALPANRFAKSLAAFQDHAEESSFRELLREFANFGVDRPGGYADVFHEHFNSPRINWSVNARLAPAFAGGWQEAIKPGAHRGTYYKYDLNSAYLWAATLGLPDHKTYRRCLRPWSHQRNGLYRVRLLRSVPGAPFPFNQALECIATNEEIEMYSLPISEVLEGVSWDGLQDGSKIIDAVRKVSTWKQAGRAYWGRWAQMVPLECVSKTRRWNLPNPSLNIPWAHAIVSRVRMKLWEHSRNALHVYVDSVITSDVLPVSPNIGDWKLEKTYPYGVFIRAPGQYGAIESERLERMAGTAHHSTNRILPITAII